jgi:hypothetical protein
LALVAEQLEVVSAPEWVQAVVFGQQEVLPFQDDALLFLL